MVFVFVECYNGDYESMPLLETDDEYESMHPLINEDKLWDDDEYYYEYY